MSYQFLSMKETEKLITTLENFRNSFKQILFSDISKNNLLQKYSEFLNNAVKNFEDENVNDVYLKYITESDKKINDLFNDINFYITQNF